MRMILAAATVSQWRAYLGACYLRLRCLWTLASLALLSCSSNTENCVTIETVTVETVAELEGFAGCIAGDVDLAHWSVVHLDALHSVTRIAGDVSLRLGHATDLRGLQMLERIDGHLHLESNAKLVTLNGLDELESVGGSFTVLENAELRDLQGVGNLSTVDLNFGIYGCDNLTQVLDAFPSLGEVGRLRISDNINLIAVEIPPIRNIFDLEIEDNPRLERLELPNASFVESTIIVAHNERLREISGYESRSGTRVEAEVAVLIFHNPRLRSIEGFGGIRRAGMLSVFENEGLESLDGFADLEETVGLSVQNNPSLSSLRVPRLQRVHSTLHVVGNTSLGDEQAAAFAAAINAEVAKVGGNSVGWEPLDPCPWQEDGACDAQAGDLPGTPRLCAADPLDCD